MDKKYCIFIGGTYKNDNNPNKDDILNSSSDMNGFFNEKNAINLKKMLRLKIKKIFMIHLVIMIIMRNKKISAMEITHMGTSKYQKKI